MEKEPFIYNFVRGRGLAVAQAKHMSAATGKISYYYSKPKLKWYDIFGKLYIRHATQRLKKLEHGQNS